MFTQTLLHSASLCFTMFTQTLLHSASLCFTDGNVTLACLQNLRALVSSSALTVSNAASLEDNADSMFLGSFNVGSWWAFTIYILDSFPLLFSSRPGKMLGEEETGATSAASASRWGTRALTRTTKGSSVCPLSPLWYPVERLVFTWKTFRDSWTRLWARLQETLWWWNVSKDAHTNTARRF